MDKSSNVNMNDITELTLTNELFSLCGKGNNKKLICCTNIWQNKIFYKVYSNDEMMDQSDNLQDAINIYNKY